MKTRLIGSLTEIYANGGGYLTENFPTRRRHFYTKKALVGNETADMFRDATAAEKTQWDNAHPDGEPSTFRTERTALYEAAGVVFNDNTGYYELNTLTDITEEEMERIYTFRQVMPYPVSLDNESVRTNLLISNPLSEFDRGPEIAQLFRSSSLQVARIGVGTYNTRASKTYSMFVRGDRLKTVLGVLDVSGISDTEFTPMNRSVLFPLLTDFFIHKLKKNADLSPAPSLSFESMRYLVDNAANTGVISVKVHEALFAKLSGLRVFDLGARWDTAQWKKSTTKDNLEGYTNLVDSGVSVGDYVLMCGHPTENDTPYFFIGKVTSINGDKPSIRTLFGLQEQFDPASYDAAQWQQMMSDAAEKQISFITE